MIMGSLIDALKQRREDRGSANFFAAKPPIQMWFGPKQDKIKVVKERIRILPPTTKPEMDLYYAEFWAHFNIGRRKESAICGRSAYGSCPICDAIRQLQDDGVDVNALQIKGKMKGLVHLVTESEPNKVKIGMLGGSMIQQITGIIIGSEESDDDDGEEIVKQEALGDITHYKSGRWLSIGVTPKSKATPQNYYTINPLKNPSPLAPSVEEIKAILKQRVDLIDLIRVGNVDMDKLEQMAESLMQMHGTGANVSDEDEDESPRPIVKKKKKRLADVPLSSKKKKRRPADDDIPF